MTLLLILLLAWIVLSVPLGLIIGRLIHVGQTYPHHRRGWKDI